MNENIYSFFAHPYESRCNRLHKAIKDYYEVCKELGAAVE